MIPCVMNKTRITFSNCGFVFIFSAAVSFFLGCGLVEQEENRVVIVVGSREITTEALKKDMEFLSAGMNGLEKQQEEYRNQLAEQLIGHYLIIEYGKEKGIALPEEELQSALDDITREYGEEDFKEALLREYVDFDQWKDQLGEQLLEIKILEKVSKNVVPPTYREIEQYFENNPAEFRCPQMVRFRQIVTRTKGEAESLLKRIKNGENMSELARKYSIAPEAENGGEVGWIARAHLEEGMSRVLFSMPQGKPSPIVETPYGYHIFRVLAIRPGTVKELPDVIEQIETKLLHQKREIFLKKWIENLGTHFEVKINQELLNNLELNESF
jgi:parvulin-like peptidyl-prolyl isomerase